MAELLNCPFCGNSDGIFLRNTSTASFWVECDGCRARCHGDSFSGPQRRSKFIYSPDAVSGDRFAARSIKELHPEYRKAALSAIAAWNRRTPPQAAGGEPVAWQYDYTDEHGVPQRDFTTGPFLASWVSAKKAKAMPLYEHPPAVGQEWEKVVRAWRNRFISERTGYYQAQGQCYEEAIASAEYDANCYADGLVKAGIGASQ